MAVTYFCLKFYFLHLSNLFPRVIIMITNGKTILVRQYLQKKYHLLAAENILQFP